MKNYKNMLLSAYYKEDFELFNKILEEYLDNNYGISFSILSCCIMILIMKRKYDDAYKMIKWIENTDTNLNNKYILFRFYIFCFKPKDAENLLLKYNFKVKDKALLVKMYLLEGKIDKAKKLIDIYSKDSLSNTLLKYKRQIDNYYAKNAFRDGTYAENWIFH